MVLSEEIVISHTHCCPFTNSLIIKPTLYYSFIPPNVLGPFIHLFFSQFLLYKQNIFTSIFLHLEKLFLFLFSCFFSSHICVCLCAGENKEILFYNKITYTYAHSHTFMKVYVQCCCIICFYSGKMNENMKITFRFHIILYFFVTDTPGFVYTFYLNFS